MNSKNTIICPNCEKEYDEKYNFCPYCGQANKKLTLSFKYFISEFLLANFNVDSKIYQTFKLLILSPARLTTEFFNGKRARYIPPVRLYLLISLVYFAVLSINIKDQSDSVKISPTVGVKDSIDSLLVSDEDINDLVLEMDGEGDTTSSVGRTLGNKLKVLNTDAGQIAFKQLLQRYTSLGMFVLIPLTALIFFALFYRDTYYIQHLIFAIQLQSLVFLLFTVFNLIELIIQYSWIGYFESILFLIILFTWIKSYYKLSVGKTIWKVLLFFLLYGLTLVLFFTFILGFSFFNL